MGWGLGTYIEPIPIGATPHVSRNLASIKPRTLALKTNSNKNKNTHAPI